MQLKFGTKPLDRAKSFSIAGLRTDSENLIDNSNNNNIIACNIINQNPNLQTKNDSYPKATVQKSIGNYIKSGFNQNGNKNNNLSESSNNVKQNFVFNLINQDNDLIYKKSETKNLIDTLRKGAALIKDNPNYLIEEKSVPLSVEGVTCNSLHKLPISKKVNKKENSITILKALTGGFTNDEFSQPKDVGKSSDFGFIKNLPKKRIKHVGPDKGILRLTTGDYLMQGMISSSNNIQDKYLPYKNKKCLPNLHEKSMNEVSKISMNTKNCFQKKPNQAFTNNFYTKKFLNKNLTFYNKSQEDNIRLSSQNHQNQIENSDFDYLHTKNTEEQLNSVGEQTYDQFQEGNNQNTTKDNFYLSNFKQNSKMLNNNSNNNLSLSKSKWSNPQSQKKSVIGKFFIKNRKKPINNANCISMDNFVGKIRDALEDNKKDVKKKLHNKSYQNFYGPQKWNQINKKILDFTKEINTGSIDRPHLGVPLKSRILYSRLRIENQRGVQQKKVQKPKCFREKIIDKTVMENYIKKQQGHGLQFLQQKSTQRNMLSSQSILSNKRQMPINNSDSLIKTIRLSEKELLF